MAALPVGPGSSNRTYQGIPKTYPGPAISVFSTHKLTDLFSHKSLARLGLSRLQEFHLLFIENPSVSLHPISPLNLATLLPLPSLPPSPAHSCPELMDALAKPRERLSYLPLPNPDLTFCVDGMYFYKKQNASVSPLN